MNKVTTLPTTERVYSLQFWLLSLSSFLFFASFNMIIPELPAYLESLGGGELKGLIIALFTLTAGISRPFSGKLSDTIGRMPVMIFGVAMSVISSIMYPVISSVAAFMLLRLIHGFSTGFKPTGTSAYVADIIPVKRRGEAMGILGFCSSSGMSVGPAVGGYLATVTHIDHVFQLSAFLGALSILVLIGMKETLPNTQKFTVSLLRIRRKEIIEPRVIYPSLVMFFSVFAFGAVITLTPDLSSHLGIDNKGLFMAVFTGASLTVRILAGKASDKFGRIPVMRAAAAGLVIALVLLALTNDQLTFFSAAIFYGLASGIASPTIMAWIVDWSHPKMRGKAISTMFIFLEAGIGSGALVSGWMYANKVENMPSAFLLCVIIALIATILLWWKVKPPKILEENA